MFFGPWVKAKDEPIPIKTNTLEDFKEFLAVFYRGHCNVTPENVYALIDLAEAYDVEALRDLCDLFFLSIEISLENVVSELEFATKYSLKKFIRKIQHFISNNTEDFLNLEGFNEIPKDSVIELAKCEFLNVSEETLFDAVGFRKN